MINSIQMYQSPANYRKSNVSFKANQKPVNYELQKFETEATTGKKWGVGLASILISGLGQAINGQWGKGISHFLLSIATELAAASLSKKGNMGAALAMRAASVGVNIFSCVDAVKNAKSTITQVLPTEKSTAKAADNIIKFRASK